ncbi:TadE/TadG family type IV pilus assembly protein [Sphingomonas sp. CCH5-D11]|uniref:TadE/TadG family type IV pilus assembly protein n=1 Tax=Sphingomonas sp. CCH5-D11 TaxID=1768786 RepID=UPI00082CDF2C|nr:TadE/TadG family type IV pilus assembly protein [Sphingomonas sp. CCH5-D11]
MKLCSFRSLIADKSGVAMLEFALFAPLLLAVIMSGFELGNYAMAHNRVQRLAAMTADLVAQSGTGSVGATEGQIYDLFSAIELTAQPFDLADHGRVIITAVKGTDNDNNGDVENRILWQRFDGAYTTAAPTLGCNLTTALATLPNSRMLPLDEILFHVQVTYNYQPLLSSYPMQWLRLEESFTRTAMFRARNKDFQSPTPSSRFPPKKNCNTATGL